jgi:NAD(P)-dependent dehydrogenase (short-subunit alcohol dehydrogenase family)
MTGQRVAIVTAAGGGIGAAVARELAAGGYRLALLSRSAAVEQLAQELGGIAVRGSVTEAADLERLVTVCRERHGRIDAVVNHTGHPPRGPLLEIPDRDWHAGLDMLVLNVVRICRLVTPLMVAQGGGAIVNISTFATFEPEPAYPVSASLRAALAGFTKLYADQHAAAGIRMNNVLPGFIDSLPHSEDNRRRVPAQRIGTVQEMAKTIAFLLSDGAAYITGQNLRVDGGLTRHV